MINKFEKSTNPIPEGVMNELVDLSIATFGSGMSPEEVKRHIQEPELVFVTYERGKAVGFSSMSLSEGSFYLAGSVVREEKHKNGHYYSLLRCRVDEGLSRKLRNIKTTTQNPIIEHSLRNILDECVSEEKIKDYKITRKIVEGCYGRMLTKTRPLSKDDNLNRTYSVLRYERGDAFGIGVELL
ncbi:MAG: hypothetical protein AABW73_00405 [Nanoarchaeota archaeon]